MWTTFWWRLTVASAMKSCAWEDAQVRRRAAAAGELGGAIGVCCQKVSEAEVFARAGIKDILVSNQVRDPAKIDRLARLPATARASSSASTT